MMPSANMQNLIWPLILKIYSSNVQIAHLHAEILEDFQKVDFLRTP